MKLNEKTGLYENYGFWHVPFWQTQQFQLAIKICLCLVALLIAFVAIKKYLAYRKRKKLSVWEQVLLDLQTLQKENKVTVVHGKEFYVSISTLLKRYLQERFGYNVVGGTDKEVIECLEKHYFDAHIVDDIKLLFQGSTTIKFANAHAVQEQIDHDYARVVAIIQRTIPEKQ